MAFVRKLTQMASRLTRRTVTGNSQGIRRLAPFGSLVPSSNPQKKGLLERVWGWAQQASGLIGGIVKGLHWTYTTIVDIVVAAKSFLFNFNLNIGTEEVDKEKERAWVQLAGRMGGFAGQALGWVVGGVVPGIIVSAFAPNVGAYILSEVGAEAFQELSATLGQLIKEQAFVWGGIISKYTYIGLRDAFYILIGKDIHKKRKPWTIAGAWENFVENIDNEAIQNFLEEFGEEFDESFEEAGYVAAGAADEFAQKMAAVKAANNQNTTTVSLSF